MEPEHIAAVRLELERLLPSKARWYLGGMNWDWDFSRTRRALRPLQLGEINTGHVPPDWLPLYLFGEQDFADGGGASPFVGVHQFTGEVYGLDLERDTEPMYLMNSSASRFVETFLLFDQVLQQRSLPAAGLGARIRAVDSEAYDRSGWRIAIDQPERETT